MENTAPQADSEPVIEIDTAGANPLIERHRKKRLASRAWHRALLAASISGVIAWAFCGGMLFGIEWLRDAGQSMLTGLATGAIVGVAVVLYTVYIEIRAALTGRTAAWNIGAELSRKSPAVLKLQFALTTILLCGCGGLLIAGVTVISEGITENTMKSSVLLAITVAAATLAGIAAGRRARTCP